MCEHYHCTPGQLDQEDAVRLLQGMRLDGLYKKLRKRYGPIDDTEPLDPDSTSSDENDIMRMIGSGEPK